MSLPPKIGRIDPSRLCRVHACSRPLRHPGRHTKIGVAELAKLLGVDHITEDQRRLFHRLNKA